MTRARTDATAAMSEKRSDRAARGWLQRDYLPVGQASLGQLLAPRPACLYALLTCRRIRGVGTRCVEVTLVKA
ncbi:hypothetical protein OIE67_39000 [Nonomuraea fuscirosea]|uniref:hypothetical protein n=1 Tax=Nonomuraea fuscirosea TaxID=1291556 RepID=UPI002DDC0137|nr:hypothetical protein [Nonomuraea fuscirosea]WSA50012.1 hypothetical protein OIE67_39000 [Nonomuraea fuscirosea]